MQLPKDKKYTYADYLAWDNEPRYELIDGVPYMMAPAPSTEHQSICGNLFLQLGTYLSGKTCRAFFAPFDVRLNADAEDNTVVQPDLAVICDPNKITKAGCKGAPDMIIEILSPATMQRDQITKLNLYRDAGVREYWIVSPESRGVQVYLLENGKYNATGYTDTSAIAVSVLDDCTIDLGTVFPPVEQESSIDDPPWDE